MLEATKLSKRFGGLQAVDNVSLAVPEGRISALIGPNGAGKTTLFALLSGFIKPDQGTIHFLSKDVVGLPPHRIAERGMARTFQIVQPFATQTVHDNIAVGAHLRVAKRDEALRYAAQVAERVGLSPLLNKRASDLTVAGRKRLELARALATQPKLLLLDEVLAGLNPSEIEGMLPVVRDIAKGGVTVFMIEHVMQAVMNLAEHVWVLAQGRLIAQGAPSQVTREAAVIEAYLGHGAAARLNQAAA